MSTDKPNLSKKKKTIQLSSLEALTRDVGRGIARIDYDVMDQINVVTGDVIEIIGKKTTVAKCLPLMPLDQGKAIIRIDGLVRNNANIDIGDIVKIRKTKAVEADTIMVYPLEQVPPLDERYLSQALESIFMMKGDILMVPYFGGRLTFAVKNIKPEKTVVLSTKKTSFRIVNAPKSPNELKIIDAIVTIEKRIIEQEKKIMVIVEQKTMDSTKIIDILKIIDDLKKVKKHFQSQK